jgi:hypothetical protein
LDFLRSRLRRPSTIEVEWVRAAFVRQPPWGNGETAEKGYYVEPGYLPRLVAWRAAFDVTI